MIHLLEFSLKDFEIPIVNVLKTIYIKINIMVSESQERNINCKIELNLELENKITEIFKKRTT